MGVLNITPDSFSDGGKFTNLENAILHAKKLIDEGADIIDIGGESTRPGADEIDIETEINRTIPIIKAIREFSDILISIDTRKPEVATAAIENGANIWNDVTALSFSENSIEVAAKLNVPIILMHAQGTPKTMQAAPSYRDVVSDILAYLSQRMGLAIVGGVKRENIILDIGIGFGKTLENNLDLLAGLTKFQGLGRPLLIGASRKRMISAIDEKATDPSDRLAGSIAIAISAINKGAKIIRVHDVKETRQAILVNAAINSREVF